LSYYTAKYIFHEEGLKMNRQQFLAELNQYLTFFSPEERVRVVSAYNEKFDSAGLENEFALIAELGTPMKTAIDLKRRMESGEKIALAADPEAREEAAPSEYNVETEPEETLNATSEAQEAVAEDLPVASQEAASEELPVVPQETVAETVSEVPSEVAPEIPVYEAPQKEKPSEYYEENKTSRKISVGGIIGATLLSIVIVAVCLVVAAVGVIFLVGMSYLLLTGLKNLLYITDALLLFGGGLVCAGLGLLIIWFAVWAAISLISKLFRSAIRTGSDKECVA